MRELGISPSDFQAIHTAPSFEAKCDRLEDLQKRVKQGFKKAALRLHPDIPENRTEEKSDLFKLVGQAVDDIMHLQVRRQQPMPPPRVVIVRHPVSFSTSFTGTSANTTTTAGTGTGFSHINIRFV